MDKISENEVKEFVLSIKDKLNVYNSIEEIVSIYNVPDYSLIDLDSFEIKEGKKPESAKYVYFPWFDVLSSMYTIPDKVYMTDDICPNCGTRMLQIYFSSPSWTWRKLCGRAGYMTLCPNCPKQVSYRGSLMS